MRETTADPRYRVPAQGGLADLIFRNAEEAPDSVAFHRRAGAGWSPVTAREFADEVTALARGVVAAGIGPGDRVAILSGNRYEWTLVDFAFWAVGAVPVPIYLTSSREQIQWIMSDSGAVAAVLETPEHEAVLAGLRAELPELRELWTIESGALDELVRAGGSVPVDRVRERRAAVEPADVATIIYTSGTTGQPKGCRLSHANFFAEAGNSVALLRPMFADADGATASTLLFLPLAHVFGRMVQVGSVEARTSVAHAADVKTVLADLATYRPSFLLSVPYVLEKAYNTARHRAHSSGKGAIFDAAVDTAIAYSTAERPGPLLRLRHAVYDRLVYRKLRAAFGGRCRYAISGGAALGERLTHFYRGVGITVFEGYGLTETCGAITVNSLDSFKPGTVGQPLPSVTIRISDDGEVLAKGAPVFSGYWRNEEATAATFVDGWFATGDIGALDADGHLRITGRKKEILVTSGGKNVAPAVIEDRIAAHPLVAQAVVVGDGRKYVAALITLDTEYFQHWKVAAGKPPPARPHELLDDPDLLAEIQSAVDEGNAAVSGAESVRRFRLLAEEFTTESGHLTPSLKLRRSVIMADFATEVEALYQ